MAAASDTETTAMTAIVRSTTWSTQKACHDTALKLRQNDGVGPVSDTYLTPHLTSFGYCT